MSKVVRQDSFARRYATTTLTLENCGNLYDVDITVDLHSGLFTALDSSQKRWYNPKPDDPAIVDWLRSSWLDIAYRTDHVSMSFPGGDDDET